MHLDGLMKRTFSVRKELMAVMAVDLLLLVMKSFHSVEDQRSFIY